MGGAERLYHVFRQGDKPGIFILMVSRPSWTHCVCVGGVEGGGVGGGEGGEEGEGSRRWYNVCSLSTYMCLKGFV